MHTKPSIGAARDGLGPGVLCHRSVREGETSASIVAETTREHEPDGYASDAHLAPVPRTVAGVRFNRCCLWRYRSSRYLAILASLRAPTWAALPVV